MNTKESYIFTDRELAKEAADYQTKLRGMKHAVIPTVMEMAPYIVTSNYTSTLHEDPIYIAEPPDDQ